MQVYKYLLSLYFAMAVGLVSAIHKHITLDTVAADPIKFNSFYCQTSGKCFMIITVIKHCNSLGLSYRTILYSLKNQCFSFNYITPL